MVVYFRSSCIFNAHVEFLITVINALVPSSSAALRLINLDIHYPRHLNNKRSREIRKQYTSKNRYDQPEIDDIQLHPIAIYRVKSEARKRGYISRHIENHIYLATHCKKWAQRPQIGVSVCGE